MKHSISLEELKKEYLWGLHRGKIPYATPNATGGEYRAHVDRPNDWKPYALAVEKVNNFDGYALRLASLGTYTLCGLDIDAKRDENSHTGALLSAFAGTYVEYSPSGKGIHVLMLMQTDRVPVDLDAYMQKNSRLDIEFYIGGKTNRYLTFTGNQIGNCTDITDMTEEVLQFLDNYMRKPITEAAPTKPANAEPVLDENAIVRRINDARQRYPDFVALFDNGDASKYDNDESRADAALCGYLSLIFNNPANIDSAFRKSALYRTKWDERHGAQTYGEMTIARALETRKTQPVNRGNSAVQAITIESLAFELENYAYTIKLNDITRKIDVWQNGKPFGNYNSLLTRLHSDLRGIYKGCDFKTLAAYLEYIAGQNCYNPILEYIDALTWDGKSRLDDLYALMGITESDWLSRVLIRKWLLQSYAMLRNNAAHPYGAEGVLTLSGVQHAGKTSLFKRLAMRPEWFGEGQSIDSRDKDTLRRACTRWIVELGEVESTMKSDIERTKAFITADTDVYRVPYGRMDEEQPRRSSLCATCNSDRYLIDQTGNRRWFTVPIEKVMPYADIQAFPAEQLWAEIAHIANYGTTEDRSWRLSEDELDALNIRNSAAAKMLKGQDEIADIFADAEEHPDMYNIDKITASDWKDKFPSLRPYSVDRISKALKAQGIQQQRSRNSRFYLLPIPISGNVVVYPRKKYNA